MNVASTAGAKYSVQKTLTLETSAERAFRVFTEEHGHWWPAEYAPHRQAACAHGDYRTSGRRPLV